MFPSFKRVAVGDRIVVDHNLPISQALRTVTSVERVDVFTDPMKRCVLDDGTEVLANFVTSWTRTSTDTQHPDRRRA